METRASLAQRVLAKAAVRVGGPPALAAYLRVELVILDRWLEGHELPPAETLRHAVTLIMDER